MDRLGSLPCRHIVLQAKLVQFPYRLLQDGVLRLHPTAGQQLLKWLRCQSHPSAAIVLHLQQQPAPARRLLTLTLHALLRLTQRLLAYALCHPPALR